MDRLQRIIHPSGHGAFFSERIIQEGKADFIVVYDCGSSNKYPKEQELIENEAKEFFNAGDIIDILFISHFDSDHVNGIKHLMPYLSNHTKLVMPFSYEYFYLSNNSPILEYMSMVMGIADGLSVKSYWVRYADIPDVDFSEGGNATLDSSDIAEGFLNSGIRIGSVLSSDRDRRFKWIYVPFNLYDDRKYRDRFEGSVISQIGKAPQEIKPQDLDNKAIERLREIYKELGPYKTKEVKDSTRRANGSKNINFNSLIVLSKATHYNCDCHGHIPYKHLTCMHRLFGGYCDGACLYTGDSNFGSPKHVDKLDSVLRRYTELPICLFQLPHHGSRQYYCNRLLRAYDMYTNLFVNCGQYDFNQKSFPQMPTDVKTAGRNMVMVTGQKYCRMEQEVRS